jgi:hypothetical protein
MPCIVNGQSLELMHANQISHVLTLNGSDFKRYIGIVAISPADVLASMKP